MRLERITVRGMLRFDAPATLDLTTLPPGLIAVVGQNGAGKSTLLEAPLAALYRSFPSRADKELVDYAAGRDAYLEAVLAVEGRGTYRARVSLDAVKRASAAVLEHTAADGTRTVLNDGKLSTYDAAVAAVFPSQAVLLASAVAAQNRAGSFVALDKRGKKDLFTELLGLNHYEQLATTARAAAALHETARQGLLAQQEVLARDGAADVGADLEAQALQRDAEQAAAVARREACTTQRTAARARRAQLVDDATTHRTATARLRELATEAASQMVRCTGLRQQQAAAQAAADAEVRILQGNLQQQAADVETRVRNNETLVAQGAEIRAAAARVGQTRETLQATTDLQRRRRTEADERRADVTRARQDLQDATQAARDLTRDERAAALLGTVPCGGAGDFGACSFLSDARQAKERLPALRARAATSADRQAVLDAWLADEATLQQAVATLEREIEDLRRRLAADEAIAARLAHLENAEMRIAELRADYTAAAARSAELQAAVEQRLASTLRDLDAQLAATQADSDRVAAQTADAMETQTRTADAVSQLDALDHTLGTLDREVEQAAATAARLEAERAEIGRRLDRWRDCAARLAAIAGERRQVEDDGREWALLAKAFGRDGLPVLEIDAAGPTVSAYCNDLLAVCFGPRFTVELITQAEKADGKGTKEVFELRVYDNLRGGDARDLQDLSGGEQILVDEALKNALALFVNSRHAGAIGFCLRDETTAPLDPENAVRYIEMLRRVQRLGGFHHTLFVSHNASVAALADAQVRIADGTLSVHLPPYSEAA
jgi:DNA repair protein SbcC/Rad50